MDEININGIAYIPKTEKAKEFKDMPFCIIRTYSAGVFAGYIENRIDKETVIRNAIRIWYWDGANSLSQLAVDGTLKPENCKFAVPVDKITVTETIEILDCTEKAKKSIQEVESWVFPS